MVKLYPIRRELKIKDLKNIGLLRFGSLTDFTSYRMSMAEVSRRLGINYQTVVSVLRRVKMLGASGLEKSKWKRTPALIGNTDIEKLLLSEHYLTKWGSYNLRE